MRAARFFLSFLVAGSVGACTTTDDDGSGGAGGAGTTSTASSGGGAETCYEPTPASGEDSFVATDGANTHTFEITLPDDPEGGLVTVTLMGFGFFSDVRVKGTSVDETFLSINGVTADDDPVVESASFVGAPGVTYELHVEEASVTATDSSVTVPMTWSLEPVRDCFEPNDTPAEARTIAFGEDVEGFLFTGFTTNDWPTYEDHHDYFAVEVEAAGTLTATLEPGINPTTFEIFAATAPDTTLTEDFSIDATPMTLTLEVEPGTYLLRVEPFISPIYTSSIGDMTGWDEPYTLRAAIE